MLIRIIPINDFPKNIVNAVRNELPDIFNARCIVLANMKFPDESYNHWRKQYDAEKILNILCKKEAAKFIDKDIPSLFLVENDIYYDNLNFVFGLEDSSKGATIISIARLKPEFYGKRTNYTLLPERVVKEAVHEIGHYLGLGHCNFHKCVMSFSNSVEDVDIKEKFFCENCKVKAALKGIELE